MAITSAFQADDAGSIPAARSNLIQSATIDTRRTVVYRGEFLTIKQC